MDNSIFNQVWNTFGERKPNGVLLELFNFLKENFYKELQSWSAEKICSFIWNYKDLYKSHYIYHKNWNLNVADSNLISTICYQFNQHMRILVPRSQWEDNFDSYWIRVNVTLETKRKEKENSSRFPDESDSAYNKRIEQKIYNKCRKIRELEHNKMQLDFFSKHEEIWNEVEGFEEEVFNYLNEYYADDAYVLSWTQEDLKTFIYDFAENYIRWIFKLELKSWPSNPDFEWLGDIYNEFAEHSYRFSKKTDESPSKFFKRIDLTNKTEDYEIDRNPQLTDESNEEYEARIHNIIAQKCKKIIDIETSKLRTETKEKIKFLKETYPHIFGETKYVGGIYGFPLEASLVALDYGGRNIYVTYADLMKWDNTEDFEKIILTIEY